MPHLLLKKLQIQEQKVKLRKQIEAEEARKAMLKKL
jgi:hypothetical protein